MYDSLIHDLMKLIDFLPFNIEEAEDGGVGSGNFGHSGRMGQVGGSSKTGFMTYLDSEVIAKPKEHSIGKYIDSTTGKLDKNRAKKHGDIVKRYFTGVEESENPTIYFNGGGSASGKTSAVKSGLFGNVPELDKKNGIVVDADEIKKAIPEYRQMLDEGNPKASAFVHEESSAIAKLLFRKATKIGNYDVLMDGTLAGNTEKAKKKILNAKETGRPVVGNFVTVDIDEALKRNYLRYLKTGRFPSVDNVIKIHKEVSRNFPELSPAFSKASLVDNNLVPYKIAETNEKGELKILDKQAYKRFLNKINEPEDGIKERFKKNMENYEKEYLKDNPNAKLRKRVEI